MMPGKSILPRSRGLHFSLTALSVILLIAAVQHAWAAGPVRFNVSIDPAARSEPASGRVLLLLSKTEVFNPGTNGTPVFGMNVNDLKPGKNAYFLEHDWTRVPRGGERDTSGNLIYTQEQENLYEEAIGDRCRSGGQWAIWNAVFAPAAEDGYPKPLWDPITGKINKDVVQWAGEHYDLRRYLEKNWPIVGSKLAGKIHVYVGRMDNFYLNEACYLLQESLERLTNPPCKGEFQYGDRAGHGWSPFKGDEQIHTMAEQVLQNSADGRKDWIY